MILIFKMLAVLTVHVTSYTTNNIYSPNFMICYTANNIYHAHSTHNASIAFTTLPIRLERFSVECRKKQN